jgi:hypothetical protein
MEDSQVEVPLSGGNVGDGLFRVGDTVRRPARPWSASVDALLLHLEEVGFHGAPRALGYDQLARQVLSYVDGYVDPDPSDLSSTRIEDVGSLIRDLHDALGTFVPRSDSVWNVAIAPDKVELICHHDLAPWNLVRTQSTLAFIDWDGAGPGSRLWDLAYAAHGFVPLSSRSSLSDASAAERLASLVRGYGLAAASKRELITMLGPRIRSMYELLRTGFEEGRQPWSTMWANGHGDVWLEDAVYTEKRTATWSTAVGLSGN